MRNVNVTIYLVLLKIVTICISHCGSLQMNNRALWPPKERFHSCQLLCSLVVSSYRTPSQTCAAILPTLMSFLPFCSLVVSFSEAFLPEIFVVKICYREDISVTLLVDSLQCWCVDYNPHTQTQTHTHIPNTFNVIVEDILKFMSQVTNITVFFLAHGIFIEFFDQSVFHFRSWTFRCQILLCEVVLFECIRNTYTTTEVANVIPSPLQGTCACA